MTWWNGNWKWQEVKITNNAGKYLYGYQVLVTLTNSNFDFQHANTHGKDFRAVSPDGTTSYPYYIEKWDWGQEAKVWVRIPIIAPGEETTFFIYYGNPNAEDESTEITFDFFDNWDDNDISEWTQYNDKFSVSDGIVTVSSWDMMTKAIDVGTQKTVRCRLKPYGSSDNNWSGMGVVLSYQGFDYDNFIRVALVPGVNKVKSMKKVEGNYETYSAELVHSEGEWCILEAKDNNGKISVRLNDGDWIVIHDYGAYTFQGHVGIWEDASPHNHQWDWFLIRKCADPEPITELGRVDSLIINYEFPFEVEYEATHLGKYTYLMNGEINIPHSLFSYFRNAIVNQDEQDFWFYVFSHVVHSPPFPFPHANPLYVSNNTSDTLYDVTVFVDLTSPPFDYSVCGTDGWNLKIMSPDYTENYPFWIQNWNYGGTSRIWIKLPEVPPGTNVCAYVVYGFHDANEVRPQEPEKVFLFYDGFEDGDLHWSTGYRGDYVYGWSVALSSPGLYGDYKVTFYAPPRPLQYLYSLYMKRSVNLPPGKKVLHFWHKEDNTTCPGHHRVKANDNIIFEQSSDLFSSWTHSVSDVFEEAGEVELEIEIEKNCYWEWVKAYVDDIFITKVYDANLSTFLGGKLSQLPLFFILKEFPTLIEELRFNNTLIAGYTLNVTSSIQKELGIGMVHTTAPLQFEFTGCPTRTLPFRFPYTWTRRRAIIINNETGEDIEDCQVYLELTPANFDYSHCNQDGSDIRFVDAKFSKSLPFFFQKWEYNGTSKIWVRVDKIPKGSNICMYMYYDNPCTGISRSDASQVFKRILPVRFWYPFEDVYESEDGPIETKEAWGRLNLRLYGEENVEDIVIDTPWGKGIHVPPDRYWTNPFHSLSYSQRYAMAIKFKRDEDNPCQDGEFVGIDSGWGIGWRFGIRNGKIFHDIHNLPYPPESDEWTDIDTLDSFDWEDLIISDNGKYRAYFRNGELRATHKNTVVNKKDARNAFLYIGHRVSGESSTLYGSYDEVVIFSRELLSDEVKDYHECRGEYFPEYVGQMFLRKNVRPLPSCSLGNEELATPLWDIVIQIQHSEDIKFNTTHLLGEILNVLPEIPSSFTAYSQLPTLDEEAEFLIYDMVTGIINRDNATIEFGDVFIQKKLWILALLEEYPQLVTTFFSSIKEVFSVSPNISITKPVHWTIRGAEVPDLISYKVTQEWAAPDTAELRFRGIPQFLMGDYIHIVYESGNSDNPEVTLFKGPVLTIDRELVSGREETIVRAVSNEWYLTKQNCFWGDESTLFSLDPNMTVRALLCYFLGGWDCNVLGWNEDPLCIWWNIPSAFEKSCENWRNTHPQWGGKNEAYKNVSEETWWSYWRNCSVGRYYKEISGILPVYFEEVPDWKEKYVMHAGKSGFNFFYGTSKWDAIMQICNVCDCVFFCTYWDKDSCRSNRDFGRRLAYFLTRNTCENVLIDNRIYEHPPVYSASDNGKFKLLINPLCRDAAIKVNDNPEDGNLKQKLISIRSREEQSSEETKINRLAVSCQDFPIVTVEDRSGNLKPVEEYISISDVNIEDLTDLQQFAEKRLEELRTPNVSFEARFLDFVLTNKRVAYEDRHCSYVTCLPLHTGMYIGFEDIDGLPQSSDKDGYYRIMKITYEMGEQTGGKILTTLECRDVDLIHPGSPKLNEVENIMHREAKKIEKGPILPGHPCPSNPRVPMLGELPWMEVGEIIEFHPEDKTVDVKIHKTGQVIRGVPLL